MLDAPPPVPRAILFLHRLVCIERRPHRSIADCVRHHLVAMLVEGQKVPLELLRRIQRRSLLSRRIRIGIKHARRMCLNHAVSKKLDDARSYPIVMKPSPRLIKGRQLCRGNRVPHTHVGSKGSRHPHRQLTALVQFLVKLHLRNIAGRVHHSGHAVAVSLGHAQPYVTKLLRMGHRHDTQHQVLGPFLQNAGGVAGLGIAHDNAANGCPAGPRIWRPTGDVGRCQRQRINPQAMPIG